MTTPLYDFAFVSAVAVTLRRQEMLSHLRLLAGRLLVLAIYVGLAVVGVVLLVWGFFFALAVIGGLLVFSILMRIFGFRQPMVRFTRTGTPPAGSQQTDGQAPGNASNNAQNNAPDPKPASGVIELQRRDDGSYE